MSSQTALVYDDLLSRHTLSDSHPMKPDRLRSGTGLGAQAADGRPSKSGPTAVARRTR